MRGTQITTLKGIVVIVVQVPLLVRENRLAAAGTDRFAPCHLRRVPLPYQPMRSSVSTFHFAHRKDDLRDPTPSPLGLPG